MKKELLRKFCLAILLLPALSFAGDAVLLDEDALLLKTEHERTYQLLDARNAEAQKNAQLANVIRYQPGMKLANGLIFVIADTDAAAMEIGKSIPAATGRSVFAVKGGVEAWKRVLAREIDPADRIDSFVIPKNTCEPMQVVLEIKSGKQKPKAKQPAKKIKPEQEPKQK
jgi:hypothetical protein